MAGRLLAALIAGVLAQPMAAAQMPPEIAAQVRAIGRTSDPLATARIYAPLQPAAALPGLRVERDLRYGSDPKQSLDLFAGPPLTDARPVLVMVHGGGFVGGDKSRDQTGQPSKFYDNLMLWAVGNGMVGVNIDFRLAPEHRYPAAQQDIGAAIGWVQANAARYGGDPRRIYLIGHSSGAAHVASYLAHPQYGPGGSTGVARAVLSSGIYDVMSDDAHPYFGVAGADRSAIAGLIEGRVPYMVIVTENDPQQFHRQAGKLIDAACRTGTCPHFLLVPGHGHMSGVYSINTSDRSLSAPVLEFLMQGAVR